MTTIKTTCSRCGDVELGTGDLSLQLDPERKGGWYLFTCPYCTRVERRIANERVVTVLLATGVAYEVIVPDPITESEIEKFVAALEHEHDLVRLIAS